MAFDTLSTLSTITTLPVWAIVIISIWALIWKGLALWKSARKSSPIWFVVLLVVNTLGILEILYLFVFSKLGQKKSLSQQKAKKKKR